MDTNQPSNLPTRIRRLAPATLTAIAVAGAVIGFTALHGNAADDTPPTTTTTTTIIPTTGVGSAPSPSRSAYRIVEDEIDRALDEHHRSRGTTETDTPPAGFAPNTAAMPAPRPAYLIIQDEIDRALAERQGTPDADG